MCLRPYTVSKVSLFLVAGEIRCYCNDASCVATGYMCKSASGRCFSHLAYEGESSRSTHGCVESLAGEDREACDAPGDVIVPKGAASIWPILKCCQRDMCNYMDDVDVQLYVGAQNNASAPVRGGFRLLFYVHWRQLETHSLIMFFCRSNMLCIINCVRSCVRSCVRACVRAGVLPDLSKFLCFQLFMG